jgi:hypothetical protein
MVVKERLIQQKRRYSVRRLREKVVRKKFWSQLQTYFNIIIYYNSYQRSWDKRILSGRIGCRKKTEDRKVTETKMTMCKTRGEKIDLQVGNRKEDREVKQRARANRSKWMSWLAKELQLQLKVI